MSETYTVLIYQWLPEYTYTYRIPDSAITPEWRAYLNDAHGWYTNASGCESRKEALDFLCAAVTAEEHRKDVGEDSGFKPEHVCLFDPYKVPEGEPLPGPISSVIVSGFIL